MKPIPPKQEVLCVVPRFSKSEDTKKTLVRCKMMQDYFRDLLGFVFILFVGKISNLTHMKLLSY